MSGVALGTTDGKSESSSLEPVGEWALHFTCGRNPADRGFSEREGNIHLPSDGELDGDADAFAVLLAQIRLGGIVPGFPDGIRRKYTPRPSVLAQDLNKVNFARRRRLGLPNVGIALLKREILAAGASRRVFQERPDLEIEELLIWCSDNDCTQYVPFRSGCGVEERIAILPTFMPGGNSFSRLAVFTDSHQQAEEVQHALEIWHWSWAWSECIVPPTNGPVTGAIVLWPSDDRDHFSGIPGLRGFHNSKAVSPDPDKHRCAEILSRAVNETRRAMVAARNGCHQGLDIACVPFALVVADSTSPMLGFLISCKLASEFLDATGRQCRIAPTLLRSVSSLWTPEAAELAAMIFGTALGLTISVYDHGND